MSCPFSSSKRVAEGLTCPFSGKKAKVSPKDPMAEWFEPCYSVPYISPYYSEIEVIRKKFACEVSQPTFYLINSLCHDSRIKGWRTQPIMARLLLAEELKQGGNRNFSIGKINEALLNYEHALGLFKSLVMAEDKLKAIEDENLDAVEFGSREGVRKELLLNVAISLIKLKHFDEAEEVLQTFLAKWGADLKAKTLSCWLSAEDLGRSLEDIEGALETLRSLRITEDNEFRKMLHDKLHERRADLSIDLRRFFNKFLSKLLAYSGEPQAYSELEFEHQVLLKLQGKYTDLLKFCIEMERSPAESLKKHQVLKSVVARMNFIYSISATSPSELLRAAAEENGVDLQDRKLLGIFEGTKRQLIVEAFAEGNYDQNLLSYCIEQCMEERQTAVAKVKADESDGFFTWQLGLSLFLVIAAGIYYYIQQSNSLLSRLH